jgi:hypothetical protein
MATEHGRDPGFDAATALRYAETLVYALAGLLALSLLVVGTVAVIAALKHSMQPGQNWHWAIHLESTVSYMGLFVSRLLAVLVPLFAVTLVGRRVIDDA